MKEATKENKEESEKVMQLTRELEEAKNDMAQMTRRVEATKTCLEDEEVNAIEANETSISIKLRETAHATWSTVRTYVVGQQYEDSVDYDEEETNDQVDSNQHVFDVLDCGANDCRTCAEEDETPAYDEGEAETKDQGNINEKLDSLEKNLTKSVRLGIFLRNNIYKQLAMKAKHERKIKGIKEGYARAMGKQREGLLLE
ncbi:unnamed protein product [Albugo candida]|uniref:Uncharacterized protein n=1 Tax=Albugo candida TaxID=65357 RepID=A0A024G8I3_9STRA|nr:unnamed protein product [Albugo candida]|eukprot:CCI42954.1 unnamed protein product [Albugo candida]